jgi:hypothetical protein
MFLTWFYYGEEVSYLKVFGCKAFVHIPQDERSKLDLNTRQCIFLGYGGDRFDYKFFYPITRKVMRSRDVVFVEDQINADKGESWSKFGWVFLLKDNSKTEIILI